MVKNLVARDPKTYVSTQVWDRQVALLLRDPGNTQDLAERKFGQCIAFLIACSENPDRLMSPSAQVDEAWHSFMLDSIPYHHFTHAHFGRYIHHVPELPVPEADGRDPWTGGPLVLKQTIDAVRATGFRIDAGLWGMKDAAKCNQCHAGCHDSPK